MPLTIHIHGHPIELRTPYTEGHSLTLGEAQALNGLRAENLRNNIRRSAAKREISSPEELRSLAALMDENYKFLSQAERAERPGPLRIEAQLIARDEAEKLAREMNVPLDEGAVEQMMLQKSVWDTARERIAVRAQIARKNLEDL